MRLFLCALSLAAGTMSCLAAAAAEIKVLTAGAYKAVLVSEVPEFERLTGHRVTVQNDTAGALVRRIKAGEAFDVAVLTPAALEDLVRSGQVVAGSPVAVARVGIGVAVKKGAPVPDIASTASFTQALLAARAVAYIDPAAGGTSGIYLSQLFERMGIADRIKPKAVLVPGGYTAERLVSGEADIAVQQMSELVAVPGATVVGPLPAEVQNYTVYAAAVGSRASDREAAAQLLSLLQGARMRPLLEARGMLAP